MSSDAPTVDFRTLLEEERSALLDKLRELGHGDTDGLSYDPNFADTSQVTAERGEAEVLAQSLMEALGEVESALHKLTDGTYGVCESCGQAIPSARLEAKPAARRCMDCASRR